MATIEQLISRLTATYQPGKVDAPVRYYFSVEGTKVTLVCHPDRCDVEHGPSDGKADVVIKCTKKLFEKVFLNGKRPGPIDIARGNFKTNDVAGLQRLEQLFAR